MFSYTKTEAVLGVLCSFICGTSLESIVGKQKKYIAFSLNSVFASTAHEPAK